MYTISNQTFDQERALYGSDGVRVVNCQFDGPADGESAFKESRDLQVENCYFNLRYPFWHDKGVDICTSEMTPMCRAALWYSEQVSIADSKLHGIKALRECTDVQLQGCEIRSPEFGWLSKRVKMRDCTAESEYFMLHAEKLDFSNVTLQGKYSFQYITDSTFDRCTFHTKDAFWHAKNVVVKNSVIEGEYLAWYCENVTFQNCVIRGTQPLCYCKGLRLIDCELHEADLSFEKSEVQATLTAPIVSIKNPDSGRIVVPSVGELIGCEAQNCEIKVGDRP